MTYSKSSLSIKVLIDEAGFELTRKLKEQDILTPEEFDKIMKEGYRIVSFVPKREQGLNFALVDLEK